jgi:hypothetical protein
MAADEQADPGCISNSSTSAGRQPPHAQAAAAVAEVCCEMVLSWCCSHVVFMHADKGLHLLLMVWACQACRSTGCLAHAVGSRCFTKSRPHLPCSTWVIDSHVGDADQQMAEPLHAAPCDIAAIAIGT